MKKRIVSVLMAAALVLSNMSVVYAAETESDIQEVAVNDEAAETEIEAAAQNRSAELAENERSGLFITFGDKTISGITDQNFNKTLTIPSNITVSDGADIKTEMQNVPAFGITGLVSNQYTVDFKVSPVNMDSLITSVKKFRSAVVSGKIGEKAFRYDLSGKSDANGTIITAKSSDAANAYRMLDYYITPTAAVDGMKMAKGTYIQVGLEKIVYDQNYQGDVIIGGSQTSLQDLQDMIRGAFSYTETSALPDAQIAVFMPQGSYFSVGGKAGLLREDMLIKVSGLNDGYSIVNTDTRQTMLNAMLEARTASDMLQVLLRSVNSLADAADGAAVNVDVSFSGKPPVVAVTGISLDTSSLRMETGDTKQLTATITPADATDQTVVWTSSNAGVVSVENGMVKALKAGKAVITAKTSNGKSAACQVNVELATPSGFKVVTAGPQKIKLSWKKVQGASQYEIYRADYRDGKYKRIKKVSSTSYVNKNLRMGSKYYYKIRAVYGSVSSDYTAIRSAYARLVEPKVSVKAKKKSAIVKWSKLKGASGYQIYYKRGVNGAYKLASTVKSKKSSLKVKKLKSKKVYYFKVRGYKNINKKKFYGEFSSEIKVKIK